MKCSRKGCENNDAVCKHTVTGDLYCPTCAAKINATWPGRVAEATREEKQRAKGIAALLKQAKKNET
jgi:hypothetical protein